MRHSILVYFLFVATAVQSQEIQSLTVGGKMPDEVINIFGQKKSVRFSSIKENLVIVDFWATWCGICVANFPKLDSLQREFKGHLKVLLVNEAVNKDGYGKVKQFYDNWKAKYNAPLQLETVVDDIRLRKVFPHQGIPHYAWIYNGDVIGITAWRDVNRANIRKILNQEPYFLTRKLETHVDGPLFLSEYLPQEHLAGFSILVRGDNCASRGYNWKTAKDGTVTGITVLNASLVNIYKYILYGLNSGIAHPKRMLLQIKDSSRLFYKPNENYSQTDWEGANLFSFEFSGTAGGEENIYDKMVRAMNFYSGYEGKVQWMKRKCLILSLDGKGDQLLTKGGASTNLLRSKENPSLHNGEMSWLVQRLNELDQLPYPVFDETGYLHKIDLQFKPGDFAGIESLTNALNKYGLKLTEVEREMDMFVITEK